MRHSISTLLGLVALAASGAVRADTIFYARLTPVEAGAEGTAIGWADVVLNNEQTQLSVSLTAWHLMGSVTASHIHNAGCNQFGLVVFGLTGADFENPVERFWNIPPTMVQELFNERLYFVVHTDLYPGGELRGQIRLLPTQCFGPEAP